MSTPSGSLTKCLVFDFDQTIINGHTGGNPIYSDVPADSDGRNDRNYLKNYNKDHLKKLDNMCANPLPYMKEGFMPLLHELLQKNIPIYVATRGMPRNASIMINGAYNKWCEENGITVIKDPAINLDHVVGRDTMVHINGNVRKPKQRATLNNIGEDFKRGLLMEVRDLMQSQHNLQPGNAVFVDDEIPTILGKKHDAAITDLDLLTQNRACGNRVSAVQLGFKILHGDRVAIESDQLFSQHPFFTSLLRDLKAAGQDAAAVSSAFATGAAAATDDKVPTDGSAAEIDRSAPTVRSDADVTGPVDVPAVIELPSATRSGYARTPGINAAAFIAYRSGGGSSASLMQEQSDSTTVFSSPYDDGLLMGQDHAAAGEVADADDASLSRLNLTAAKYNAYRSGWSSARLMQQHGDSRPIFSSPYDDGLLIGQDHAAAVEVADADDSDSIDGVANAVALQAAATSDPATVSPKPAVSLGGCVVAMVLAAAPRVVDRTTDVVASDSKRTHAIPPTR